MKVLFLAATLMTCGSYAHASGGSCSSNLPTMVEAAQQAGQFGTLLAAVDAAGLKSTIEQAENIALFAPTDAAFAALPEGTVEALLGDIPALQGVLTYHVIGENLNAADVLARSELVTLQGGSLAVRLINGEAFVNNSKIVVTDIATKNGTIHVIDAVLVP